MNRKKTVSVMNKQRIIIAFIVFCIALTFLCFRVGYVQIGKGDDYKKKAVAQQTKDEVVEAKRGEIADRNGEKLAVSTVRYSIWVRPSSIKTSKSKSENEEKVNNVAVKLADILGGKTADYEKQINKNINLVKVAKYQKLKVIEKIRNADLDGVTTTEETKRYYPLGNFASQLLGSITDDNNGLSGLEEYYNSKLRGVSGRSIQNTDVSGNSLTYGNEKYYNAENGESLELTIDEVIQHYAEQSIASVKKNTKAKTVSCLVMNPKTGEVLAMASTPGFDPNNSRIPELKDKASFAKKSEKQQLDYLNEMWRNPLVSDTYEPGSTFKLLTTSMALEEDKVTETETFNCTGSVNVAGTTIKCWIWPGVHGKENLKQAVGNSCNPVFVELAQRVGKKKFYDYLDLFGITQKTGIDYPGEANSQIQDINKVGLVELSTMGFGQGIAVTPIQLLTAISSLGNDGMMMQPHLVKAIKNAKGKTIKTIEPEKVRQTVSKETADKICEFMEYVVEEGGGTKAKVAGYRVGGKTGTAQKKSSTKSGYDSIIASFVGMAPIDDPKIAILYIVDEPEGEIYGSEIAAPGAQKVMAKTLKYLDLKDSEDKGTSSDSE